MAVRTFALLVRVSFPALVGFVACTATNDEFFDPSQTRDALVPLPALSTAGSGGGPSTNVIDPPPGGSAGSPSNPGSVEDAGGRAGSPGTGSSGAGSSGSGSSGSGSSGSGSGDAGVPLPPPLVDDGSCDAQCARNGGLCSAGTCVFNCAEPGSCNTRQLICPSGMSCEFLCGDEACTDNVLCRPDSTCKVSCQGERSCAREVICEGTCDVSCSGERSCRGGIGGASQLLELSCSGTESCGSTVQCEGQECRVECSGVQSCNRVRIFAAQNTLICSGASSCEEEVDCNGVRCTVQCASNACDDEIDCDAVNCQVGNLQLEDENDNNDD
jgi:hypothetical protein